ncbi:7913_t:CDS:2, partial [Cetraspora pellucida]
ARALTPQKRKLSLLNIGKPQQKKAKLSKTTNSAKVNQDMNIQTSCPTDNTSFNWANITEKELQGSEIWEDILSEQTKACIITTEETNNTRQNNNDTADKHMSNQNSQSGDNNQAALVQPVLLT